MLYNSVFSNIAFSGGILSQHVGEQRTTCSVYYTYQRSHCIRQPNPDNDPNCAGTRAWLPLETSLSFRGMHFGTKIMVTVSRRRSLHHCGNEFRTQRPSVQAIASCWGERQCSVLREGMSHRLKLEAFAMTSIHLVRIHKELCMSITATTPNDTLIHDMSRNSIM